MRKIQLLPIMLILFCFVGLAQAKNLEIIKNENYRIAKNQIDRASYNIVTIPFYSHPENPEIGRIPLKIGRGTVVRQADGTLVLVSANHVLMPTSTETAEIGMFPANFRLQDVMIFIIPNNVPIYLLLMNINMFSGTISENRSYTNALISRVKYDEIFDHFSELSQAVPVNIGKIYHHAEIDLAKIEIDLAYYDKLNYIGTDLFAKDLELEMGYEVAMIGCPNGFGTVYREGVVSASDFFNVRTAKLQPERYVISIYSNGGDSGSLVFGTDQNGELKILGLLTHAQPMAPGLGIVYTAPHVIEQLKL